MVQDDGRGAGREGVKRDPQILIIEIQAIIQQMQSINSQAQMDLSRGGEWRCDYAGLIWQCDEELNRKIAEYESITAAQRQEGL